jgi:hypothetical protein
MTTTVVTDLENIFIVEGYSALSRYSSTDFPTDKPRYPLETAGWRTPKRYDWRTADGAAIELYIEHFDKPIGQHQNYGRYVLNVDDRPVKVTRVEHIHMTDGTCRDSKITYKTKLGDLVVELIPDELDDENHTLKCTWVGHPLTLVPQECSGLQCLYRMCTKPLATPEGQCSSGHVDDDYPWEPPDSWD